MTAIPPLTTPGCPSVQDTLQAMVVIGMSEGERSDVFRMLAAVLHLGSVDFIEMAHASVIGSEVSPESAATLLHVASLLRVAPERLTHDLCALTIRTSLEVVEKQHDVVAARGAFIRVTLTPRALR